MNQLVSDVKRALDEIKRLKGRVDSLGSVTAGSSSGSTSGVLLSNANPQPVGAVASPGVDTKASRSDHVHVGQTIGKYRQFVYDNANPFQFVTDGNGQPIFSLESLE